MVSGTRAAPQPPPASPYRGGVGIGTLIFGLFAAPIVWSGQELVSSALSGYACYPDRLPLVEPTSGFGWVWPFLIAICAVALIVSGLGCWVSLRSWQRTRGGYPGDYADVLQRGEGLGRFLAISGLVFSAGFLLAVVFNTIATFLVPLCGH